ncbi:hypothetical protein P8452_08497 [Trifolium repens]|nr:hypothetical protein P8452_08497 [Trifolium repens]
MISKRMINGHAKAIGRISIILSLFCGRQLLVHVFVCTRCSNSIQYHLVDRYNVACHLGGQALAGWKEQ